MKLRNQSVFVGKLTTIGRKSGLPRSVELRMVYLDGRFYASSAHIQTKHWCRNLINDPAVEVSVGNERFPCQARQVTEEGLRNRILVLRDSPALADRTIFEMTPTKSTRP